MFQNAPDYIKDLWDGTTPLQTHQQQSNIWGPANPLFDDPYSRSSANFLANQQQATSQATPSSANYVSGLSLLNGANQGYPQQPRPYSRNMGSAEVPPRDPFQEGNHPSFGPAGQSGRQVDANGLGYSPLISGSIWSTNQQPQQINEELSKFQHQQQQRLYEQLQEQQQQQQQLIQQQEQQQQQQQLIQQQEQQLLIQQQQQQQQQQQPEQQQTTSLNWSNTLFKNK